MKGMNWIDAFSELMLRSCSPSAGRGSVGPSAKILPSMVQVNLTRGGRAMRPIKRDEAATLE